jgi:hypothetical protein
VPVLILAAAFDVPIALDGVQEIYLRTPEPRRMFVLRRADHEHFADDVLASHEKVRAMTFAGEAARMPAAMLPASELCGEKESHAFTRGLTLAHLDASLRDDPAAAAFLAGRAVAELAARHIDGYAYLPEHRETAGAQVAQ